MADMCLSTHYYTHLALSTSQNPAMHVPDVIKDPCITVNAKKILQC